MKRIAGFLLVTLFVFGVIGEAWAYRPPRRPKIIKQVIEVEADREIEQGIGIDLVIWENEGRAKLLPDALVVEGRWDIKNEEGGIYCVAVFNLWERLFKK